MIKFNMYASLVIMFIGVFMASAPIVICGFVATNIWAAADILLRVMKQKGGAA